MKLISRVDSLKALQFKFTLCLLFEILYTRVNNLCFRAHAFIVNVSYLDGSIVIVQRLVNGRYTNCFGEKQLHSLAAIVGRKFGTNSILNLSVYDEGITMPCLSMSLTRPRFLNFGFMSIQV